MNIKLKEGVKGKTNFKKMRNLKKKKLNEHKLKEEVKGKPNLNKQEIKFLLN